MHSNETLTLAMADATAAALAEPTAEDFYSFPYLGASDPSSFQLDEFGLAPGLDDDFDLDLVAAEIDFSVDDFLNLPGPSPDPPLQSHDGSGASSNSLPSSPDCDDAGGGSGRGGSPGSGVTSDEVKREAAEEKAVLCLKRKIRRIERDRSNLKCLRSDEVGSPTASMSRTIEAGVDSEEDRRRAARLLRNRESALLSRQRKKKYMEELEEKVRSMHSVINDLNAKISFVMAENASLRQQLTSGSTLRTQAPLVPAMYPPPGMQVPWIPAYALRPHGSTVPLVPIPRLKPIATHPPVPAKKPDPKKAEHKPKTKKVVSITFLGLLFILLVCGAVIPGANWLLGLGQQDNKVFGRINLKSGAMVLGKLVNRAVDVDVGSGGKNGHHAQNSSEILPALLYVPRNGKHVKINGNLIIHSVLASEKAMTQPSRETSLAVSPYHPAKIISGESSPGDSHLPQWFREGMAGSMLSSGMCTEVFQFDVSPASANHGTIIPANAVVNSSTVNATTKKLPPPVRGSKSRNRRIINAIPLPGCTLNNTNDPLHKPSESSTLQGNNQASSVVVSVLIDPREAGDADGETRISPKPTSRIFVVTLLNGVKYVTYSCMLPFKNSSPHLVN